MKSSSSIIYSIFAILVSLPASGNQLSVKNRHAVMNYIVKNIKELHVRSESEINDILREAQKGPLASPEKWTDDDSFAADINNVLHSCDPHSHYLHPEAAKIYQKMNRTAFATPLDQSPSAMLLEWSDTKEEARSTKLGIIKIPSFHPTSTYIDLPSTQVSKLIAELKARQVEVILLDLRYNVGGHLEEAVKIAGFFLSGPIVYLTENRTEGGKLKALPSSNAENSPPLFDGPLALLVNEYTASASEIVAAAFQDRQRALILGSKKTYGKGTVQGSQKLTVPDPKNSKEAIDVGILILSVSKFYRLSGISIQRAGVEADIELTATPQIFITETSFPNALPADGVDIKMLPQENVTFVPVKTFLTDLKARSKERGSKNTGGSERPNREGAQESPLPSAKMLRITPDGAMVESDAAIETFGEGLPETPNDSKQINRQNFAEAMQILTDFHTQLQLAKNANTKNIAVVK